MQKSVIAQSSVTGHEGAVESGGKIRGISDGCLEAAEKPADLPGDGLGQHLLTTARKMSVDRGPTN
jgi:hypothetical protein